ncbi:MAG: hypothetical protein R3F11_18135 [Verrucomicrobiales bacterium]
MPDAVCNWLHNGQGGGSTESRSLCDPGANLGAGRHQANRSSVRRGARYWLPTRSEWRKSRLLRRTGRGARLEAKPIAADIPMQAAIQGGGNAANFGNVFNRPANVDAYRGSASYYGAHCLAGNVW